MAKPVVSVFPHSDDEFDTSDALREFLHITLPKVQRGRYLLRKLGWKDKDFKAAVVPGSLVLFRKGAYILGDGIVEEPIRELKPPVCDETELGNPMVYYHDVVFEPGSIRVYSRPLPVATLETWSRRRIYPSFYAILGTRSDYETSFPR